MLEKKEFARIFSLSLLALLVILSFLIIRPILMSILGGLVLAYIFLPVHRWLVKYIREKNISALIICSLMLIVLFVVVWFVIPSFGRQVVDVYFKIQKTDFVAMVQRFFPALPQDSAHELGGVLSNFVSNSYVTILSKTSKFLLNLPIFLFNLIIVFFTFFFTIRDADSIAMYLRSISPISRELEKKFFTKFKEITNSVIYVQIVAGMLQGILTGFGLFLFHVPAPLVLGLIAVLLGDMACMGPSEYLADGCRTNSQRSWSLSVRLGLCFWHRNFDKHLCCFETGKA